VNGEEPGSFEVTSVISNVSAEALLLLRAGGAIDVIAGSQGA